MLGRVAGLHLADHKLTGLVVGIHLVERRPTGRVAGMHLAERRRWFIDRKRYIRLVRRRRLTEQARCQQ